MKFIFPRFAPKYVKFFSLSCITQFQLTYPLLLVTKSIFLMTFFVGNVVKILVEKFR